MSKGKDHKIIQETKIFKDKDGKINADVISGKSHHRFIDLEGLHQHRDDILKEQKKTETSLAKQSLVFWDWYKNQKFDFSSSVIKYPKEIFRVCPEGREPIDTTGSVINGGRHHVGGPQQHVLFSDVNIFFALYASADIETAGDEYIYYTGLPLGPRDKSYSITIVDGLKIFDLDKIVETISYPGLESTISDTPVWGEWKYQKVPHISQLLGYLLYRDYQADGLMFNSTKHDGKNIVLFFNTNSPRVVSQKIKEEKEL